MVVANWNIDSQDSILLAQTVSSIQINEKKPTSATLLQISKSHLLNANKKYCLFLDGIEVQAPPEGVYEIYLTTNKTAQENLVPESSYFVNVLDTYSLTGNKEASKICLNVTRNLLNLSNNSGYLSNYYITVLFKSNLAKDSGQIDHPGKLIIDSIKLIQID
jgi:hypothetical protein